MDAIFYATCDGCGNHRIVKPIYNKRLCYDCVQEFSIWLEYRKQISKEVAEEVRKS